MEIVEYPIRPGEVTEIEVPEGTRVLSVQPRGAGVVLQCQCEPSEPSAKRTFLLDAQGSLVGSFCVRGLHYNLLDFTGRDPVLAAGISRP